LATDERFSKNSLRVQNRDVLKGIIEDKFASLTKSQVTERLDTAQIANAQANEMQDVWAHPQLQARDRWRTINSGAGVLPAMLPPGVNSDFDYVMGDVPALGEHTQAILQELGFA